MLLAIDPGTNSPGVALFENSSMHLLVCASRIRLPSEWVTFDDGKRWPLVAETITQWALRIASSIDHVILERPQWYQRKEGGSKGDPNKLAGVLAVGTMTYGMLSRFGAMPGFTLATPAEWIGQISKECPTCEALRRRRKGTKTKTYAKDCPDCHGSAWETPRGRRIRSRLRPSELALAPDQNDAIDAIGLGLWKNDRLKPEHHYSNS